VRFAHDSLNLFSDQQICRILSVHALTPAGGDVYRWVRPIVDLPTVWFEEVPATWRAITIITPMVSHCPVNEPDPFRNATAERGPLAKDDHSAGKVVHRAGRPRCHIKKPRVRSCFAIGALLCSLAFLTSACSQSRSDLTEQTINKVATAAVTHEYHSAFPTSDTNLVDFLREVLQSENVVLGSTDPSGREVSVADNGTGQLVVFSGTTSNPGTCIAIAVNESMTSINGIPAGASVAFGHRPSCAANHFLSNPGAGLSQTTFDVTPPTRR